MFVRRKAPNAGFTLIEVMIVIAILGILAAIAIPNYIAYRKKGFCTMAESDAASVASVIADYYGTPSHTQMVTKNDVAASLGGINYSISGTLGAIVITVPDPGECPRDNIFQLSIPAAAGDGWS